MVERGPGGDGPDAAIRFSGDTFNTAWYLARAQPDWQIDYLTQVGEDATSDAFLDFALASGIGTGHIARHPSREMGQYVIEVTDGERSFEYARETSAARMLASDEARLLDGLRGADIVYFSGITLAILPEDHRELLFDVMGEVQAEGAIVAFDPNIREALWSDTDEMRGAIMEAALSSDIILPSFAEEARLFGDAEPKATMARYLSAGAQSVVVKNGAGPIHYSVSDTAGTHQPGTVAQIIDTTAAGDSFNAGFLGHLISGHSPAEAVAAASQLAEEVIQHHGALLNDAG